MTEATGSLPTPPTPATPPAVPPPVPPSVPSAGWSPLGPTPVAPPQPAPSPFPAPSHPAFRPVEGPARYLPPVAPPPLDGAPVEPPAEPPTRSGRWGWRTLVAFLAGGLVAAGGFAAARVSIDPATEAASGPGRTAAGATPATRPPVRGTVPATDLEEPPSDIEPAAYVAQVLGPSVVQLGTTFGLGSGVLYDDHLVLTNDHVVGAETEVTVTLATGRVLAGTVIGTDHATDVAVVRVETEEPLPQADLAIGVQPQVGQLAVAIGSPFDLQQSVTQGIVSAVDRPVQNSPTSVVAMIQTDAPINPGNSGGALADRFGRVIGINTSIQTDGFTTANVGVGFAIPIDTAVRIADLLAAGLPIERGFLGVRGGVDPGGEVGVVLTEITTDSAAESAGLRVGDRVVSLDGAPVTEMAELAGLVLANQAGDTIVLEVVRDGETVEVEVELGVREDDG